MTLKFETSTGELYEFKGVNHNIVFVIYYYEPKQHKLFNESILNPNYKADYTDYLREEHEQEGESDEDDNNENFSRDNLDLYKKNEMIYENNNINNNKLKILEHSDI